MKVIIDLIEDIRESIGDAEEYILTVGLLKEDMNDVNKLIYSGEARVNLIDLNQVRKELIFSIDSNESKVTMKELIPSLLILDMDAMMYQLKVDVNAQYSNMEVVGFGKNDEQKRYILFIKI